MENNSAHIVSTPETAFGKPRINGTRFAVKDVVILHLYNAMPLEQIAAEYHLPLAGVYAAMSYYYDHKEETDKKIEDDEKFVEEFKKKHPSLSSKRKLAI
jgi:uncharacterized protein (DUF433 family)